MQTRKGKCTVLKYSKNQFAETLIKTVSDLDGVWRHCVELFRSTVTLSLRWSSTHCFEGYWFFYFVLEIIVSSFLFAISAMVLTFYIVGKLVIEKKLSWPWSITFLLPYMVCSYFFAIIETLTPDWFNC